MADIERLSLDRERLAVAVDVYEGYAHAHVERGDRAAAMISASCLIIAGSYASMLDPPRAKRLFRDSAFAMLRLGRTGQQPRQDMPERYFGSALTLMLCSVDEAE